MKTLKDFYIVVTKQNKKELEELLNDSLYLYLKICFEEDHVNTWRTCNNTKNKERISLSKLKRYIDNTPTREGLKKAKNASKIYKYKYEQCKKESEELLYRNERLQYNLDNLRSEREQLTNLAKKDINLGKKTLIEWTCDMYNNEKYLQKECTVLGISNKNLELNNTKLNLENDHLNKEIRKYKIVAMCSLLLTLLVLGLWF